MTNLELQKAFEIEANIIDKYLTDKIYSSDIEYWLNTAVNKFVKTRFDGDNPTHKSFEQTEKRSRDLVHLVKSITLVPDDETEKPKYTYYNYTYPIDLLYVLSETTNISCPTDEFETSVFECTVDNYINRINNKLTDFHYRNGYARPLRVRTDTGCMLFTDGIYFIGEYNITYIKKPTVIDLNMPDTEYKDFTDSVLSEIVKLAVQMYIESVGNQRYQTITNEVNTME